MNTNKHTAIYLALASALVMGSTQVQAQTGNTKFGTGALISNTSGGYNSAFGQYALLFNTTGGSNTAIGTDSLYGNKTGSANTAIGVISLTNNNGSLNTAIGVGSLRDNYSGSFNTASGAYSLGGNEPGSYNTASGYDSLFNNRGNYNTASGTSSLYLNTTGLENTAMGYNALYKNTISSSNTAIGAWSLYNSTGANNNALGHSALYSNTTGTGNSAIGRLALNSNTSGSFNVGIGGVAGYSNKTGSNNVFIGNNAGYNEVGSNKLYISSNKTTPLLYGVFSSTASDNKLGIGTSTVAAGDAIKVWNGARLTKAGVWANASSRELKDNIEAISTEDANEALAALSPVRYVYKNSRDEEYMGFIAEDVPDLVASNDRKSLSPMDIVAVLTTVTKDQAAKMTEKDAEIAALRDSLAKQDERMLQMEMALAEVLRKQSSENQIGSRD